MPFKVIEPVVTYPQTTADPVSLVMVQVPETGIGNGETADPDFPTLTVRVLVKV